MLLLCVDSTRIQVYLFFFSFSSSNCVSGSGSSGTYHKATSALYGSKFVLAGPFVSIPFRWTGECEIKRPPWGSSSAWSRPIRTLSRSSRRTCAFRRHRLPLLTSDPDHCMKTIPTNTVYVCPTSSPVVYRLPRSRGSFGGEWGHFPLPDSLLMMIVFNKWSSCRLNHSNRYVVCCQCLWLLFLFSFFTHYVVVCHAFLFLWSVAWWWSVSGVGSCL